MTYPEDTAPRDQAAHGLLAALFRSIDERLAAIEANPLATSHKDAANLARNEARGIVRAEFAAVGVQLED